ncbi:MAG: type II toxin-antitoxin system PemK/MazF family toxin [Metallibacterium scheffleri]|nr:type II toxin-antitoxin system PemK/MazF family toxin [Pseudomonadota bacterium]
MKRGDLVTIALQGDQGKPRTALVIQSDFFAAHPSVTVLPVTSELRAAPLFRVDIEPGAGNGLRKPSQVMLDKAVTVARDKIGASIGVIDAPILQDIERRLAVFLGIAK